MADRGSIATACKSSERTKESPMLDCDAKRKNYFLNKEEVQFISNDMINSMVSAKKLKK